MSIRANRTVRRLAETVVAMLRDRSSRQAHRQLAMFQLQDWEASYHWLDANGLALYLRNTVRANQFESSVPREVLVRLDQNQTDNRSRFEQQLVEFRAVNESL